MAPKDGPSNRKKGKEPDRGGTRRNGSPTGSDGSGQSASSTSSLGLRELFDQLPPEPPSNRRLSEARVVNLDPESLEALPQRQPWYSPITNGWHYLEDSKLFSAVKSGSSHAAKWVGENDHRIVEAIGAGGGSIMQGAGIAGAPAAAPADLAAQAGYGAGVALTGLVATYRAGKEASKIVSNYRHPDRPQSVNYRQLAADIAAAGLTAAYGAYSTGMEQNPHRAQTGMATGAIGAGLFAVAGTFAARDEPQHQQPAPPAQDTPAPAPTAGGYQLDTPYHASMTSLTQQMQGYGLSDLTPAGTRTSSVATGFSDPYGRTAPQTTPYPRQPYQQTAPYGQPAYTTSNAYSQQPYSQQPAYTMSSPYSQQPYQQTSSYPQPPQNPVSGSVESYSHPAAGTEPASRTSRSGNSTSSTKNHHHKGNGHHHKKQGGGSGPAR
ncbi:hypothetical protein [Streptomyces shenzhenensis]|uniref:Uncharacterized protein n=1 Tax=Streptomyces shenzhenensis TaxID=943815 RepID=A0A3M0I4K9_9ACTN|nr:hypothetical protein [Streptomyces shenzhenensis]RMB84611.1 hypothetical protein CTZ28_17985 [Streptomyces shenzhenensis]